MFSQNISQKLGQKCVNSGPPRANFGRRGVIPEVAEEGILELVGDPVMNCVVQESEGRHGVETHRYREYLRTIAAQALATPCPPDGAPPLGNKKPRMSGGAPLRTKEPRGRRRPFGAAAAAPHDPRVESRASAPA